MATGPRLQPESAVLPVAPPFASGRAEEVARGRLRRNRRLATGLLATMGAVFVGTHLVAEPGFAMLLLRAGAEAGIVGGIADWFAVTALFRRPLGLPIPHTAIIPNSKDRIARTLGRFIERNFLTEEILLRKLADGQVGQRFAAWLAAPGTAPVIAGLVAGALPGLIRSLEDHDLQDFANRTLGEQLRRADLAPILGRVVELATASGEADILFERAIGIGVSWLEENRGQIDRLVEARSRWWVPKTIDRRIAAAIVSAIADLLGDLRRPDSEARLKFREALAGLIEELLRSPARRDQINASKNRILDSPEVQAWLASIWGQLSRTALEDLADPASKTRAALEHGIALVGRALAADGAMQAHVDAVVRRLALQLVSWRRKLGGFIAEVVRGWDTRTLTDRLELVVGSDLQYIRMNGTIVGALVGCAIFLVSRLFG